MLAPIDVLERAARSAACAFAADVLEGLSHRPRSIPSMYFYDEAGSRLFQQITELEEYYLTRCERSILEQFGSEIATLLAAEPFRLVELGAGDGSKTRILLSRFLDRGLSFEYVPVDICEDALVDMTGSLRRQWPASALRVHGIVAEYTDALAWLRARNACRTVVLFLGSNIGNFEHQAARSFLASVRRALHPGDYLLIGFDLKKDAEILWRAYNDAEGITRRFNFNLLDRINRELAGEFDRDRFRHHGPYNAQLGRMESWLVSRHTQHVKIGALGRSFTFRRGEGIFLECSYKYDVHQIDRLARASGFIPVRAFYDQRRYFTDVLWQADSGVSRHWLS